MLTRDMLRTLASYLGKDPDAYLSELTRLDDPGGVTVDGFYMTLSGGWYLVGGGWSSSSSRRRSMEEVL